MKDYIRKIRSKIGHDKFIHPAARIIVENDKGEILFVERLDNGTIGIPAGSLEENETIEKCIIREVYEETGLEIKNLEVIGISTNPNKETVEYPNGDKIQYFTIEFYSNDWEGKIDIKDRNEIKKAKFMDENMKQQLPENELSAFKSWHYYREYGRVLLS